MPNQRDELQFHLIVIVKEIERVYQLIDKADRAAKDEAEEAEEAFDEGMAKTRSRILLALTTGLLLGLAIGWLFLHFAVKQPLSEVIATLLRLAKGDVERPVPQSGAPTRSARSSLLWGFFAKTPLRVNASRAISLKP